MEIYLFIASIFWTIVSGVTIFLFTKVSDLNVRTQRIEDVQGNAIDRLAKDFDLFRNEVKEELKNIAHQIHKEKNEEGQLRSVLTLILQELERRDERNNK